MKREQFLTLILTIVAVIAAYVVLKPRVDGEEYVGDGFGANARPVYVGGEQKAPAHSAGDALHHGEDGHEHDVLDDIIKKNTDSN